MKPVPWRPLPAGRLSRALRLPGHVCARVAAAPGIASALLILLVVWELSISFLKASRKTFWYDELVTFHVSSLQPLSLIWKALQAGVDGASPGFYGITELARLLPGDPHVILRLPSILGYVLGLLGVYWFARKRLPTVSALTAVILISLSPFRAYAIEARPYAWVVGFLAISAALWQRIGQNRLMTPMFALFLALAVCCHHYAVVAISSFGMAELAFSLLSRKIRWGVWAACLFASGPFFLGLPLLLHFREVFGSNYWARPGWAILLKTYAGYLGLDWKLALVLVLFFGITLAGLVARRLRSPGEERHRSGFRIPEIFLLAGFLLYPALLVVLAKLQGGGYTVRYGWPSILGLALGAVFLIRTSWPRTGSARLLGALLIVFVIQGGQDSRDLLKARPNPEDRWSRLAELSGADTGIPVVVGSGLTYLEAAHYASPDLRNRLVQVVDDDIAIRLAGTDSVDKTNRLLSQFHPLRVEDSAVFLAAHRRFFLQSGGYFNWLTPYLVEQGYHLSLLDAAGSIYLVEE